MIQKQISRSSVTWASLASSVFFTTVVRLSKSARAVRGLSRRVASTRTTMRMSMTKAPVIAVLASPYSSKPSTTSWTTVIITLAEVLHRWLTAKNSNKKKMVRQLSIIQRLPKMLTKIGELDLGRENKLRTSTWMRLQANCHRKESVVSWLTTHCNSGTSLRVRASRKRNFWFLVGGAAQLKNSIIWPIKHKNVANYCNIKGRLVVK